eukprot:515182_1
MDENYTGRGARGASYMDAYEDHYDHGGKYDDADDENSMGRCGQCSKNCLFFVNFLMLLVGVAVIALAVFVKENEEDIFGFGAVDESIIYLSISCGILIIIISFLGCVGASTNSKCILILFIILLILSLLLEIIAVIFVFTAADDLKKFAERQWDSLSSADQKKFEQDNDCCGFETNEDERCTGMIGCYNKIEQQLQNNLLIIGWICIGVFIYQTGLVTFACCLCKKIPPAKYSKV